MQDLVAVLDILVNKIRETRNEINHLKEQEIVHEKDETALKFIRDQQFIYTKQIEALTDVSHKVEKYFEDQFPKQVN